MIYLPDVTLFILDCVNLQRAYKSLKYCTLGVKYGSVKFASYLNGHSNFRGYLNCSVETIDLSVNINSTEAYSEFMIKKLANHFDTSHVLVCQHDGFVVNPSAWTNEFLEYDYIGAPWYWLRNKEIRSDGKDYTGNIVGNGGFSLRSKKLQEILRDSEEIVNYHPEDGQICTVYNKFLESKGCKFASEELASKFSVENCERYNGQFGHHTCPTAPLPQIFN
jgi:hypothetical protein